MGAGQPTPTISPPLLHDDRQLRHSCLRPLEHEKGFAHWNQLPQAGGRDLIPTSIPNTKKFGTFLRSERSLPPSTLSPSLFHTTIQRLLEQCGYTDDVLVANQEGGEEGTHQQRPTWFAPFLTPALDPHTLTIPSIRSVK